MNQNNEDPIKQEPKIIKKKKGAKMYKCTSMKQSWKKRRSRAAETLLCWEYKRAMEVLTMDSACGQFSR